MTPPASPFPHDGLTRRDFLQAGSLACLGLGLPGLRAWRPGGGPRCRDVSCILLFLVGGPSQLDTWDMKPDAPEEIRGPFRPIATACRASGSARSSPGWPAMMDKVSLVRSVHHEAAAVHDTGHQMMQTGRLFSGGIEHPHYGCVLAMLKGPRATSRRTSSSPIGDRRRLPTAVRVLGKALTLSCTARQDAGPDRYLRS